MTTNPRTRPASAPLRRPSRRTHAALVLLVAVVSYGVPASHGQEPYAWPEVRTTEPVEKPFTAVQHYHFRERRYDPPVEVPILDEAPARYDGPEEVLSGMLSAMAQLDHDWWLETWGEASRELIARRDRVRGITPEERLAEWEEKVRGDATLVRWVETGQYVILTYRRQSPEGDGEEQPVALKLSESGWVATLDLAQDPVFQNVTTDEQRIERRVR